MTSCTTVKDLVIAGGAAVEVVPEAAAVESVHAVRNVREIFDVAARVGVTVAFLYMSVLTVATVQYG